MKKKSVLTILAIVLLFVTLCVFSGCFSGDTAIVTIHIEGRSTAAAEQPVKAKSIIDRFLMLFSSPAYAWEPDPSDLTIHITRPGMEPVDTYFEVFPADTNIFSYEVPTGVPVTIEVTTTDTYSKNWGARTTVNLTPGQEADVVMKMIPVSSVVNTINRQGIDVGLEIDDASPYALGYRIYRSSSVDGIYNLVSPQPALDPPAASAYWTGVDSTASALGTYFYKVSVISEYGEGLLSDATPYNNIQ